jgi:hypothetical protein
MNKGLLIIIFFCFSIVEYQGQSNRFFKSLEDLKFSTKEVFVRNGNSTEIKLDYKLKMYEGKFYRLNLSKMLKFKVKGAAQGIEAFKKHIIIKAKENTKFKDTIIISYYFNKKKEHYFSDTIITLNYEKHKQKILSEITQVEPLLSNKYITNIDKTSFDLKLTFVNGKKSTLSEYSYFLDKSDFSISTKGPIVYKADGLTANKDAFVEGKATLIVSLNNNPQVNKKIEVEINHNIKYVLDFDNESVGSRGRNGEDGRSGRNGQRVKEEYFNTNRQENKRTNNEFSHYSRCAPNESRGTNRTFNNVINGEHAYSGRNGGNGYEGTDATDLTIYVDLVYNDDKEKALQVRTQSNGEVYTRYILLNSDFSTLKIYCRGGDGGYGGDGGDGGRGGNGEELVTKVKTKKEDPNDREKVKVEEDYYYYKGSGGDGGNGGSGGDGGDGGRGGNVTMYYSQESKKHLDKILIYNNGGNGGNAGRGGDAGNGGNTEYHSRSRDELMNDGRKGLIGVEGENGYAGRNGESGKYIQVLK